MSPLFGTALLALQAAGAGHLVVVTGIGGEPAAADSFHEWGAALVDAAGPLGLDPARVTWLAEDPARDPARVDGRSRRDEVERTLSALAGRVGDGDQVILVLIGHGSHAGPESRLNLPGPDLTAADLDRMLDAFRGRVVVVHAGSAGGDFVPTLAARDRIVISATRSAQERNQTVFPRYFAAALTGDGADVDKDGRVSVLEAYHYARREVARHYEADRRLPTEHAVLDDDGDGVGTAAADGSGDGALARETYFSAAPAAAAAGDPRVAALERDRRALEDSIAALRARRDSLPAATYDAELERLLVRLAETGRRIRGITGGGS